MGFKNKVRLFLGTFIDRSIFEFDYPEIRDDFKDSLDGRWVEKENLHFTYHFIGETDLKVANEMKSELSEWLGSYESELIFKGISAFPDLRHPKVLYVNIFDPEGQLREIHGETEKILKTFGYKPEDRPFKTHLTLMRVKKVTDMLMFREVVRSYQNKIFGSMPGYKVNLIESMLTSKGPIYKIF